MTENPNYPDEKSPSGFAGAPHSNIPAVPPPAETSAPMAFQLPTAPPSSGSRGMYTAAAVLNWITLGIVIVATFGIGLIAAAWVVPMTVLTHKAAKGPYKHTALAVCTLLFVNIISGILMLVDDSNRSPKPV